MKREKHIEAIKGLAALQVLLYHFFKGFIPALVTGRTDQALSGQGWEIKLVASS